MNLAITRNEFNCLPQVPHEQVSKLTLGIPLTNATCDEDLIIRTVLLVGAASPLHPRDKALIRYTLSESQRTGFSLAKGIVVRTANLHQGADYNDLAHDYRADIVILCFLPKIGQSTPGAVHPSRRTSPHGNSPSDWESSIKQRRPLVVASSEGYFYAEEITCWESCPPNYRKLPGIPIKADGCRIWDLSELNAHMIIRQDVAAKLSAPAP